MQAELGVRPVAVAGEYGSVTSAELAGGCVLNWDLSVWLCPCTDCNRPRATGGCGVRRRPLCQYQRRVRQLPY
jgi:hypothetical protein